MADEYRPSNNNPNAAVNRPTSTIPSSSTPHQTGQTGTTHDARTARRDSSGVGTALAVAAIFLVVAGLGYAFYNADGDQPTQPAAQIETDTPATGTTTGDTNAASPETETSPATADGTTAPAPTGTGTLEETPNATGTGNATSGGQSGEPAPGTGTTAPVTE